MEVMPTGLLSWGFVLLGINEIVLMLQRGGKCYDHF